MVDQSIIQLVGVIITLGIAQVATLRWLVGRVEDVDTRSQKRDAEMRGQMLTREEFLNHMKVYEDNAKGVRDELHRLNGRIDNLILLERRRLEHEGHHGG